MSVLNGQLFGVVAGDDVDVVRSVTDIPTGQTITKAWMTFKSSLSAADPGLLQKTITAASVAGQGQITDTGASGTGSVIFQFTGADTLALPVARNTTYDVKILTSAGKVYTVEQGVYLSTPPVTAATS